MATIATHLSVDALRERYVSSPNAREARHFHTIWLLAKGHTIGEVAEMTSFGWRWIEQLAACYNAEGPESLGDLRRRNGASATVLKPELLHELRLRLKESLSDGGVWTSAKVAAFLARELGLEKVAVQRHSCVPDGSAKRSTAAGGLLSQAMAAQSVVLPHSLWLACS